PAAPCGPGARVHARADPPGRPADRPAAPAARPAARPRLPGYCLAGFPGPMSTRTRLSAAEKARQAIEMCLRGCSYQDIADQAGSSSAQHACRAVTRALARYPARSIDQLREVESMKLDRLERVCNDIIATTYYATCARGLVLDQHDRPVADPGPALK